MEANNTWDQIQEHVDDIVSTLKSELSAKWNKVPPTNDMKCQSYERFRERLKTSVNLFLEEEDKILIKHQIFTLRDEIKNLWSLCWTTENEKLSFKEYSIDIYTEEVLVKHKTYKNHLESLYNSNSELFSMLRRYEITQNHLKELEIVKNDSNRLFTNRGAQLLKNEKELKESKKEVLKLEASIIQLATKHNHKYGKPLLIHGEEIIVWMNKHKSENDAKSSVKSRVRPWHTANSTSTSGQGSSAKKKKKLDF